LCEQVLYGIVNDQDTKAILPNAKLVLMDDKFNIIKEVLSDANGKYEFTEVECSEKYYVRTSLETYNTKESPVIIKKDSGKTELNIELEKIAKPIPIGGDLADVFGINLIYFDLDKWNIRDDAAIDLAKILDVLQQYPTMKIDIRSHTDSRATSEYNMKLSDRRAKSTKEWLIKNGIKADRLTAKGYGETQLVNKCADGVECTEAEHQLNRRSQFIITAL
jgi:outer membrane protein OmpA-like peptidoglycan-associated protein